VSVAKSQKNEYPERELMMEISDLLRIPHFSTSRGSTVRRDFLEAVCAALGVPQSQIACADKDGVLRLAIEAATGKPMADSLLSRGGTVTNAALRTLRDGILNK
jgi:hypothetical protein